MSNAANQDRRPCAPETNQIAKPVLTAVAALIALSWLGAWLFQLNRAGVLAGSLAILVLGLMVIAARNMAVSGSHASIPRAAPGVRPSATRLPAAMADDSNGANVNQDQSLPLPGKRWTQGVFDVIDSQRFAAVCETWFSWAGFDTRSESRRTHEGVDIWLHASKMSGPVAIVRCKHSHDKPVGVQELREFLGLVDSCKSAHGTFTTTSTYTPEALQFARENGIEAVDGRALLRKFQTRTRQSQQALLAVALNSQH